MLQSNADDNGGLREVKRFMIFLSAFQRLKSGDSGDNDKHLNLWLFKNHF